LFFVVRESVIGPKQRRRSAVVAAAFEGKADAESFGGRGSFWPEADLKPLLYLGRPYDDSV